MVKEDKQREIVKQKKERHFFLGDFATSKGHAVFETANMKRSKLNNMAQIEEFFYLVRHTNNELGGQ